jgi:hypothetical protein
MGKSLKSSGRVLILFIDVQSPLVLFHLGAFKIKAIFFYMIHMPGDYFSEVMPYVDYFILETNSMITKANSMADFNLNLKMAVRI